MVAVVLPGDPPRRLAGYHRRLRGCEQFPAFGEGKPELFQIVVVTINHREGDQNNCRFDVVAL